MVFDGTGSVYMAILVGTWWYWVSISWYRFPNLGVANVRILGVVNVRLANNLTPLIGISQAQKKSTHLL